ncbi:hypothetical protein AVEN_130701-1 [Araneus ventricosus]|uniref:Uncharacterized protein n=1 Tax=Araneus ventricosus TaxID=182803 RepID=A0A4Y2U590_ARAVE|nr:hypothetical protein AVEN_130701-1 [Araneus ventricosus]
MPLRQLNQLNGYGGCKPNPLPHTEEPPPTTLLNRNKEILQTYYTIRIEIHFCLTDVLQAEYRCSHMERTPFYVPVPDAITANEPVEWTWDSHKDITPPHFPVPDAIKATEPVEWCHLLYWCLCEFAVECWGKWTCGTVRATWYHGPG